MTLSIDVKRQLLSVVRMWLDQVALVNRKAKRSCAQTAQALAETDPAKRAQYLATAPAEYRVLEGMREMFGIDGNIFWSQVRMMTVLDVHVMTLALDHAYHGVLHLLPTLSREANTTANRFVHAWKAVRDVRNGLEHEEEYLAGAGQRQNLVDAAWTPPAVGVSRHTTLNDNGVARISALGRWYDVAEAVAAAVDLIDPLSTEAAAVVLRVPDKE
jgi:hypothetical protein